MRFSVGFFLFPRRSTASKGLELVATISLQSCEFVFVSVAIVFRSDVAALANSAMVARASAFSGITSSCMRLA